MNKSNKIIKVSETEITVLQKQIIFHLWNNEYPQQLAFDNLDKVDSYLNGITNASHYFLNEEGYDAWAIVFERDQAQWFAIIVDSHLQGKKIGSLLLNEIKTKYVALNGWVIDHNNYLKKKNQTYLSPKTFYIKNGFELIDDVRLEIPVLSAVKITWSNTKHWYLFQSKRLGFRNWTINDLDAMEEINQDKKVMEFFPSTQSREYTADFIKRMQNEYAVNRHCYFATELLENKELIGFIGLHEQNFESDFTPCIDIGWSLKQSVWNKGYASEGALRCLDYAFNELQYAQIFSITPKLNLKSERIMQKIGMQKQKEFVFDLLKEDERLRTCVLYKISRHQHIKNN